MGCATQNDWSLFSKLATIKTICMARNGIAVTAIERESGRPMRKLLVIPNNEQAAITTVRIISMAE